MAWDRLAVEEDLKSQIRTIAKMVSIMEPKSEEEFMAAALPNLVMWVFQYRLRVIQEMKEEA